MEIIFYFPKLRKENGNVSISKIEYSHMSKALLSLYRMSIVKICVNGYREGTHEGGACGVNCGTPAWRHL